VVSLGVRNLCQPTGITSVRNTRVSMMFCAVNGCNNPVEEVFTEDPKGGPPKVSKKKTCSLPIHQQIETKHQQCSTGSFLYKQWLQHAQISQPVDSFSCSHCVQEQDIQEDFESYIVNGQTIMLDTVKNPGTIGVADDTTEPTKPCPSKSMDGNQTLKAQFGRRWTHNEQTLVRPCGVIFARATMFGAEAVSNFLVMVKNAFCVSGAQKP